MKVEDQIKYEILYNLFPGETFIHQGRVYMMCQLSPDKALAVDETTERVVLELSNGFLQRIDKYTYVYPKDYEVRERAKDSDI